MAGAEPTKHAAGATEIPWHALHIRDAIAAVESDRELGLTSKDARERLARFGPNALPETSACSPVSVFVAQFRTPLIWAEELRKLLVRRRLRSGASAGPVIDHGS